MAPRYPRASTPSPTVPPPSERFVRLLEPWKVIVGTAIVLLGSGAAFAAWERSVAKAKDLAQLQGSAEALSAEVQVMKVRASFVEASMTDMHQELRIIHAQLVEIAKTTGARQVPQTGSP